MEEGYISGGEIKLHYMAAGPEDGEPVLLLHGFPQFSYEWRYQLKALGEAGYRAVAPDLRGYNLSDRPESIENYRMQKMVGDIASIFKFFNWQKANLVVHDWGGAIGWIFVTYYSQLVKSFVALDIAHPAAFRIAQQEDITQLQKSWYIWLFQTPEVPERFFGGAHIDRLINWAFSNGKNQLVLDEEAIATYREMLSKPGQLTAAINYYRANSTPENLLSDGPVTLNPVSVPTLLIYGTEDFGFSQRAWDETAKCCSGPYRSVALPGIGHWSPEEAPEETTRLILEHIRREF